MHLRQGSSTAVCAARGVRRARPARVLTVALAAAAATVAALVTAGAALAVSCGSTGVTVTSLHGTRFYTDASASPALSSGYTGYTITSSSARNNVWVELSGFSGVVGLNSNQPSAAPIGNLGAGATVPSYFFLTATSLATTATPQNFTVTLYQGDPARGGTAICSYADGYSGGVYDALQAAANKVQDVSGDGTAVTVSTTSPVIGGSVTLTVEGTTGTLGQGPDGTPFIYETPTSLASWPAGAFRLVATTLTLSPGTAGQAIYTNQLEISNAAWSAAQDYIAAYTFRITGTTSSPTSAYPIQEITSGTQVKHTNASSLSGVIPAIPPATNPLTLTQTPSVSSLPAAGGTVDYTATLQSSSTTSSSVDQIVDTMPAGASYVAGSSTLGGTSIADPTIASGTLVFPGPFTVSSAGNAVLVYRLSLPGVAGSYANSAVGYVASTAINTPATATVTVAASVQAQTISFPALADTREDQGPVALGASASSGLAVSYSGSTASVCTLSGASVVLHSVGTCTVTADQAGNGSYSAAASVSRSFQVTAAPVVPQAQTISFPAISDTREDQGPVALAATASSGLAVSYSGSTASVCTLSGATVVLHGVGTCTVTADQAGNGSFSAAASVSRSFQVTAAPVVPQAQTISFPALVDTREDQGPVALAATASSGLTISYSGSTASVCTLSGATVALHGVGTCTVTADQAGNGSFSAAASVSRSFQVTAAPVVPQAQTISFPAISDTREDQGPVALAATASSGLTVSYSGSTASVCTLSGATVVLHGVGTCTVTADQAGDGSFSAAASVSRSFQVTAAPVAPQAQTISFQALSDTRVDQGPVALAATASSGLTVSYSGSTASVCTLSGATVVLHGVGTCTVTADQAGDGSFSAAASVSRSFQVTAAPVAPQAQTISFPALADTREDQGPVALTATASSGLSVAYTGSTAGVCTLIGATAVLHSVGTCTITADQAGDGSYSAAPSVSRSFQVTAAPAAAQAQTISFPALADTREDQGPVALTASASSGLTVSYSGSTASVCTLSGVTVVLHSTGTCTVTADQAGDSSYSAAASVSRSFQVTAAPAAAQAQTISFPALADTREDQGPVALTATASSGLSVSYTGSTAGVCTLSGATVVLHSTGTCTITADQAGNGAYSAAASVSRSFQVTAAPVVPQAQTISFPALADTREDQGPVALGASASSGLSIAYTDGTPSICTLSGVSVVLLGTGTCTITADQAGNGSYSPAASVSRSFLVAAVLAVPPAPTAATTPAAPAQPPLPAAQPMPTSKPVHTTAGIATSTSLGGIPSTATVVLAPSPSIPGVAKVEIHGSLVTVTPTKTFSGIATIPVVVTDGEISVVTTVSVLVAPASPTDVAVRPVSATATRISWRPSPSAHGYEVKIDGQVVCRTTDTGCTVDSLVGAHANVVVTATGNAGTRSLQTVGHFTPNKPVLLAVVHFATDSYELSAVATRILDATQTKIRRYGFAHAILKCHTDNVGSLTYDMALSERRCEAVVRYLEHRFGIKNVSFEENAFAFLRPFVPNTTRAHKAENRRVEIFVK